MKLKKLKTKAGHKCNNSDYYQKNSRASKEYIGRNNITNYYSQNSVKSNKTKSARKKISGKLKIQLYMKSKNFKLFVMYFLICSSINHEFS